MDPDAMQHQFSLIESIPPSADLHLAAEPVQPATPRNQSPIRQQRFQNQETGSFLSNIEPAVILEALVATSDVSPTYLREGKEGKQDSRQFIRETVAEASQTERVWGIRAARAGKSIKEWHDELASWPWPKTGQSNGFQAQYNEAQLEKSLPQPEGKGYRANIPSSQIGAYEMKVEAIRKDLGLLELEDLKGHVRDVHVTPNSKRTPLQTSVEAASYDRMDDFAALITATIVQSLPTLARLTSLMNAWSLRLVVMRLVPDFMRDMASCKDSMLSAHMAIGTPGSQTQMGTPGSMLSKNKPSFSRNVFGDIEAVLNDQISETGKKLDAMLDLLEGSNDVLPDQWIDSMDELENEHNAWAAMAEEVVLDNEDDEERVQSLQDDDFAILSDAPRGSQYLSISDNDARALSSLSEQAQNVEAGGKGVRIPTINAETEPEQPQRTHSRNYSIGVRKPTGVPEDTVPELTNPAPARNVERPMTEKRASAVESNVSSDPVSTASRSGSMDSDYISNGSSPEIRSATFAAYPGSPIQVTTPSSSRQSVDFLTISKRPDLYDRNTRQSWSGVSINPRSLESQRKRSSTFTASPSPSPSPSPHPDDFLQAEHTVAKSTPVDARPRSASIKSFEVVPRSEVRTIEVRRSNSHQSAADLSRPVLEAMPSPRGSARGALARLQGEEMGTAGSSSETSLPSLTLAQDRFTPDQLPTEPEFGSRPQTPDLDPAQISFAKTRDQFGKAATAPDLIPETVPQERAATLGDLAPTSTQAPLPKNNDRLEAQISSILTKIPADIRLTSAAEAAATHSSSHLSTKQSSKTFNPRRVSVRNLIRSRTSTPTPPITLAPAPPPQQPAPPSSSSLSKRDSDIKLYHLHQPGTGSPIKLYIRLVGETGERVMVRVGGGWADLCEYLKEYAAHHGKRAASDGSFHLQNLPTNSSPASAAAAAAAAATPLPASRPSSSLASNPVPPSLATRRHATTPAALTSPPPPHTPPSRSGPPPGRRPSSRGTWSGASTDDDESPSIGLAGPKTKNVAISPRKQAWVDGMMRQARKTSVGEGGKGVGGGGGGVGVRRVFLGRGRKESG